MVQMHWQPLLISLTATRVSSRYIWPSDLRLPADTFDRIVEGVAPEAALLPRARHFGILPPARASTAAPLFGWPSQTTAALHWVPQTSVDADQLPVTTTITAPLGKLLDAAGASRRNSYSYATVCAMAAPVLVLGSIGVKALTSRWLGGDNEPIHAMLSYDENLSVGHASGDETDDEGSPPQFQLTRDPRFQEWSPSFLRTETLV